MNQEQLAEFQSRIGYQFSDAGLLAEALTHASHGKKRNRNNERLEFLGDRVLGLLSATELLHRFPDDDEGMLATRFNAVVRRKACVEVGKAIGLGQLLAVGSSEQAGAGVVSESLLGNAMEALLGAIYLDGGLDAAKSVFDSAWAGLLNKAAETEKDPKTSLQEWAQGRGLPLPEYKQVAQDGPDHARGTNN